MTSKSERIVRAVIAASKSYFIDKARWPDLADVDAVLKLLASEQPTSYQELTCVAELRARLDERRETAESAISSRDHAMEQQRIAEAAARQAEAKRDAATRDLNRVIGKQEARIELLEDALRNGGHGKLLAQYDELATAKEAAEQAGREHLDHAIKAENNAWEVAQDMHIGTMDGMQAVIAVLDAQLAEAKKDIEALEITLDVLDADRHAAVAALYQTLRSTDFAPTQADWGAAGEAAGVDWKEAGLNAVYFETVHRKIEEQRACTNPSPEQTRTGSRMAQRISELQAKIDRQKLALDGIASQCVCDGCVRCEGGARDGCCDRDAMLGEEVCRACRRAQGTKSAKSQVVVFDIESNPLTMVEGAGGERECDDEII